LNAREEEAKRSKVEAVKRKQQQAEEEAIKDAGRQMLEEAQRRAAAAASAAASTKSSTASPSASTPKPGDAASSSTSNAVGGPPEITPIDLTLVLQFPSSSSSSITTSSSSLQSTLVSRYGLISHVVLKEPPEKDATAEAGGKKKKKGKGKRAIVEFGKGNWGGCWACWRDHSDTQPEGGAVSGLEDGVKAKWAGGKTPDWVEWAEKQRPAPPSANGTNADGRTGVSARGFNCVANGNTEEDVPAPSFGSAPDFGGTTMAHLLAQHSRSKESRRREEEYESMTLLRMRQMERERLAEQIRREEEDE
jgi:DnaJ family protein C protein 17